MSEMTDFVEGVVREYKGRVGFLIPILQDVQRELNYLPREALEVVSETLEVPISQIYEVTTFYKAFSLTPRGKHRLSLCLGTACHVRGALLIGEHIERTLEIKAGETTPDLEFTYETVNCLGACALGPIVVLGDEYQGNMSIAKTNKLFKKLGKKVTTDEED